MTKAVVVELREDKAVVEGVLGDAL